MRLIYYALHWWVSNIIDSLCFVKFLYLHHHLMEHYSTTSVCWYLSVPSLLFPVSERPVNTPFLNNRAGCKFQRLVFIGMGFLLLRELVRWEQRITNELYALQGTPLHHTTHTTSVLHHAPTASTFICNTRTKEEKTKTNYALSYTTFRDLSKSQIQIFPLQVR